VIGHVKALFKNTSKRADEHYARYLDTGGGLRTQIVHRERETQLYLSVETHNNQNVDTQRLKLQTIDTLQFKFQTTETRSQGDKYLRI
jgi:hypothetical protein